MHCAIGDLPVYTFFAMQNPTVGYQTFTRYEMGKCNSHFNLEIQKLLRVNVECIQQQSLAFTVKVNATELCYDFFILVVSQFHT